MIETVSRMIGGDMAAAAASLPPGPADFAALFGQAMPVPTPAGELAAKPAAEPVAPLPPAGRLPAPPGESVPAAAAGFAEPSADAPATIEISAPAKDALALIAQFCPPPSEPRPAAPPGPAPLASAPPPRPADTAATEEPASSAPAAQDSEGGGDRSCDTPPALAPIVLAPAPATSLTPAPVPAATFDRARPAPASRVTAPLASATRGKPLAPAGNDLPGDVEETPRAALRKASTPFDLRQAMPAAAAAAPPTPPIGAAPQLDAAAAPAEILIAHRLDLAQGDAWLDRLAQDITRSADQDARLRFALAPEHLGRLTVELANGADGTAIRMTTESEQAQRIVADAQPRLIAEARAQGLRVTDTQVDLDQRSGSQQQPGSGQGAAADAGGQAGAGGERGRPGYQWADPRRSLPRAPADDPRGAQDLYA